ncbi:MAG TPA: 50S ribosomal protein L21 [Candidatus Limnocylindrales bacterium]|nr:50S ribosomal protein L21 [Candidatus Limnocylindrales bacterium]
MYAVIETGGKQYRVEVGTELEVELLDAEPGKTVTVGRVLLVADGDEASIGRPVVDGAAVSAEVVRQGRGEKVIAFKYRPKARRRVKKGHRQELTVLRISDITLNGKSAAKAAQKTETGAKGERARLEEAAAAQAAKDAELAAKLAAQSKTPTKKTEAKKPATATPKSETEAGAKASDSKSAAKAPPTAEAKADTKDEAAKADTAAAKPAAKKTTTRAKASGADASGDKPAPKKTAAKPRATKKDE